MPLASFVTMMEALNSLPSALFFLWLNKKYFLCVYMRHVWMYMCLCSCVCRRLILQLACRGQRTTSGMDVGLLSMRHSLHCSLRVCQASWSTRLEGSSRLCPRHFPMQTLGLQMHGSTDCEDPNSGSSACMPSTLINE